MKFGFNVFDRPPEAMVGIARKAEEIGFEPKEVDHGKCERFQLRNTWATTYR